MMRLFRYSAFMVAVFATLHITHGQANADSLYSVTSGGPGSNWAYGQISNGSFVQFGQHYTGTAEGHPLEIWNNPTSPQGIDPNIIVNTGASFTTTSFGQITFNQNEATFGPYGGPTAAEWTNPGAGGYFSVSYSLETVQTGANIDPTAEVIVNGTVVQSFEVTSTATSNYFASLYVAAHGHVDIIVAPIGGGYKTTQVDAVVNHVPEPTTFVLMGLGGLGMAFRAIRRRGQAAAI